MMGKHLQQQLSCSYDNLIIKCIYYSVRVPTNTYSTLCVAFHVATVSAMYYYYKEATCSLRP